MELRLLLTTLCVLQGLYVHTVAQTGGSGAQPDGDMPCQVAGCENGGTCTAAGNCTCPFIYIGHLCEKISCFKNTSVCGDNGFCDDSSATSGCQCNNGYFGAKCDQVEDHCDPNPCANGATCINSPFNYDCMCAGPWDGPKCTDHRPCRALRCINGFCRENRMDGGMLTAECRCRQGWEGQHCDIDKNECLTGEGGCLNGGTCLNRNGSFGCNCPAPTSGRFCEMDANGRFTNVCENYTCANAGTCSNDQPWRPRCICAPGWQGTRCETATCVRDGFNSYGYGDGGYEYEYEKPPIEDIQNMEFAYNIADDYCLFDGTCIIDSPTSIPRCQCKLGYAGDRCFYRTTILKSIEPLKGVRSGGTEVVFRGINMNGTFIPRIQFDGMDCPVLFGNNSVIICQTLPVEEEEINTPLNITMSWRRFNGYLDPTQEFVYKKDPTITSITPTSSIISGGVKLTVTGTGLDAVGKPILEITIVYQSTPVYVFSSLCEVLNSTVMLCPTPKLEILDAEGNLDFDVLPSPTPPPYPQNPRNPALATTLSRKKRSLSANEKLSERQGSKLGILSMLSRYLHRTRRQAPDTMKLTEFRINNETVEFHIGLRLDGVQAYRNLSETLPQYSKLTVYVDPLIERWTENQEVRSGRNILEVDGDRLTVGIKQTDYTMMIGQSSCSDLEVYNNKLVCTAPTSTPTPHESDTTQGVFNVRVHIGIFKEPFLVGKVTYKTSFFDNPQAKWGVIGACIAAGLIICIIIAVFIARKTARA